ncbi:hypothetical protein, partial [Bradyrhizobium genosp. SA-3]|uniref:hypothetical protein n=1 Tax=Bradyrhizobium genosp. SA-3 TaxID=508868 RepID=UPI001ABF6B95
FEGGEIKQSSGETRRENGKACLQRRCGLENDAIAPCSVIARSPCDEAIQNLAAEGFWIASLRSQ